MNVFDPSLHIQTITIVGTGGTGAQVARLVGRILFDMKSRRQHIPQMVLIDPDRVEPKNVGRQLFTIGDVGQYKAEVVGKRLNMALGMDVVWITEAVDAKRHFEQYSSLVISCVDNHLARREISRVPGCHISAGNHAQAGQVCIGNCIDREQMLRSLDGRDGKYAYLPHESLLFPQLLEPEPDAEPQPETLSCAELTMLGDQSVVVNDWMACVVGQYVYALLHRQPITSFLTFVQCDGMPSVRSVPICAGELKFYLEAK